MSNKVCLTFTSKSQLSGGFSWSSTSLINNAGTRAWQRQALGLSPSPLPRLALLFHPKSTQELHWGSFCSLLGLRLGIFFLPLLEINFKKWIPRFAWVENLHLYDLEKNKCIFFMPEIQREHRAVDTGSQHSSALGKAPVQDSTSYVLENVTLIIMIQKVILIIKSPTLISKWTYLSVFLN